MKRLNEVLIIMVIIVIIVFFLMANAVVVKASTITPEGIADGAGSFLESGKDKDNPINDDNLQVVSSSVYNVLLAVGIIVAVIVGIILAIKIMTGSITEKAEYKQMLIPYIAGCVVVFGAFGIWKLIVEILNQTQ